MPRYTFGGTIRDLTATPSSTLSGALVVSAGTTLAFYAAATGGTPVTDYLLDNDNDGVFETAASSIVTRADGYVPAFQGPNDVTMLWYDPDPNDTEVRRVAVIARDATTGGVPDASTTVKGLGQAATNAQVDAGTAPVYVFPNVNGLERRVDAHDTDPNAHPTLTGAIESINTALGGKVDKDANGDVPLDALPAATGATASTLMLRDTDGTATAVAANADTKLATLGQVKSEAAKVATAGSTVTTPAYAPTTPASSTSATTFTAIPDVLVTTAATGDKWRCEYDIIYRGTTAAGIQVRHKTGTAAVTNKLANPSFETDTSNWGNSTSGITTLSRGTTGGGQDGAAYLVLTSSGTGTLLAVSEWIPIGSATGVTAGVYAKPGAGTQRTARIDIQFATDAAGTGTTTQLGGATTLTAGAWTRAITWGDGTSTTGAPPPAGATHARVRLAYVGTVSGDSGFFDAAQLELTAPLPAYGATGGSGSSAFGSVGYWCGLTNAATTSDNYSKRTTVRTTDGTNMTTAHGALGTTTDAILTGSFEVTIGGTGLSNQRIELEFAQRVADAANATTVVAARATFAKLT